MVVSASSWFFSYSYYYSTRKKVEGLTREKKKGKSTRLLVLFLLPLWNRNEVVRGEGKRGERASSWAKLRIFPLYFVAKDEKRGGVKKQWTVPLEQKGGKGEDSPYVPCTSNPSAARKVHRVALQAMATREKKKEGSSWPCLYCFLLFFIFSSHEVKYRGRSEKECAPANKRKRKENRKKG